MAGLIRVLVVDDSAFVRKVVTQMLARSPFIEVVGAARDGEEALEMVDAARAGRRHARSRDAARWTGSSSCAGRWRFGRFRWSICSISHESGAAALEAFELGRRGVRAEADRARHRSRVRDCRRADRQGEGRGGGDMPAGARPRRRRRDGAQIAAATPIVGGRRDRRTPTSSSSASRPADRRRFGSSFRAFRPTFPCRSRSCCTCRSAIRRCMRSG